MNSKKLFPIFLAIPLVIAGCSQSSSKKKTSSKQEESSSITSEVSPTSESSPTSEGFPSSSGTSMSPSSASSQAPAGTSGTPAPTSSIVPASSSVVPASSDTPAPSSSVIPGSSAEPVPSSSEIPASSGSEAPSSSGTTPPDPGITDQQYLDEFNSLKASIVNNHNYTITLHSYLSGYESDPDCVVDDEFININDQILGYNPEYGTGKSGLIKQSNQGYVYFDYYGDNVLTDGFYSTNASVGISQIFDLTAENLFIGAYSQSHQRFTTSNEDVIAVAANLTEFDVRILNAPENIYIDVDMDNHELNLHAEFMVIFFDEVEVNTPVILDACIENIGSTHHDALEAYVASPTDTYALRSAWTNEEKTLFDSRNAGFYPSFPGGSSYSSYLVEYTDKDEPTSHTVKALFNNFECGDITSSYATYLTEDEFFVEVTPFRENTRLFKRVLSDAEHMTKTTNTVELAFIEASTRFPNGAMSILFGGYVENLDITTVQLFNEYLALKGYTAFVPQLNCSSSIEISHFSDLTDQKNTEAGEHAYELYTSTTSIRVHIASYSDAVIVQNAYIALLQASPYEFDEVSTSPFGQVLYSNSDRYQSPSSVIMTNLSAMSESSYEALGYFELRYQIYAEKDPSEVPTLVKIQIDTACQTEFMVGDSFSYGSGVIHALYSDGNWSGNIIGDCSFSGYEMSESGDQQVTVTYTEGGVTVYAYYTIHVASNISYSYEYTTAGKLRHLELNFCDDGTGTYTYAEAGTPYICHFTYALNENTYTFTLSESYSTSNFGAYCLFPGGTVGLTATATYDSVNDRITIITTNYAGNNPKEFTLSRD